MLVQEHFLWHFPYLEGIQGVLDGVSRSPVGPPGPLELSALGETPPLQEVVERPNRTCTSPVTLSTTGVGSQMAHPPPQALGVPSWQAAFDGRHASVLLQPGSVFGSSSVRNGCHVFPSLTLRRMTRSWCPKSAQVCKRPSANASRWPRTGTNPGHMNAASAITVRRGLIG